jgi:hypothetical protein
MVAAFELNSPRDRPTPTQRHSFESSTARWAGDASQRLTT